MNPQPVTMTRAQYQQTYGTPPNVPAPIVAPAQTNQVPIKMTKAQYQSTYGTPSMTANITPGILPQAVSQIKSGFQQTQKGVQNPDVIAGGKDIIAGTLNEAGGAIRGIFSPIEAVMKDVSQLPGASQALDAIKNHVINPTSEAISNIPAVQKFVTANPNAEINIGNAITIATALIGGNKAPEIKSAVTDAIDTAGNAINTGVNAVKDTLNETPMTPGELQTELQGVAEDWAKPTTINEAKYNNARAVLEKDPNVPTTLAQNGINPFASIEDGKYDTADLAQKLRDDNGKLSKDLLRPSLIKADATVPPTPIADLQPTIDSTYGVTADDAEAIQSKLETKIAALQRKYPNGINLSNSLDERITYDSHGGYKAFKSNVDNIDAIANRAIADSLRENLVTKGEVAGVPVGDFQAELSKNYRAADYLDALHGKKAPVSPIQSAVRYGAKILGAKIGGTIGGGGLVSDFVGYHIGGRLENFIENMTNPMRNSFLENLKTTNLPAFEKIQEYLKTTQGKGFTMKDSPNKFVPPK